MLKNFIIHLKCKMIAMETDYFRKQTRG